MNNDELHKDRGWKHYEGHSEDAAAHSLPPWSYIMQIN